jgi:pimeloyl-ACP methyl ester carboxylesterase
MQPTIVPVHGAFAEAASWDGVIDPLVAEGHRVVALEGASHAIAVSRPDATVRLILEVAAVNAAVA